MPLWNTFVACVGTAVAALQWASVGRPDWKGWPFVQSGRKAYAVGYTVFAAFMWLTVFVSF